MSKKREPDHLLDDESQQIEPEPTIEAAPRGRQGDEDRPLCPNCSTPENPVLCDATSSPALFTWYGCPNKCGFTHKQPRPDIQKRAKLIRRREEAERGVAAR